MSVRVAVAEGVREEEGVATGLGETVPEEERLRVALIEGVAVAEGVPLSVGDVL